MINTENTLGIEVVETEFKKEVGINDLKFKEGIEYVSKDNISKIFRVTSAAPEWGTLFYIEVKKTTSSSFVELYSYSTYMSGNYFIRLQGLRNSTTGLSTIEIKKNGVTTNTYSSTSYMTYDINYPVSYGDKISIQGKTNGVGQLIVEIILSGGLSFNPTY